MPEGPEVYALAKAVAHLHIPCTARGKHLFVYDQDWSFGLSGTVQYHPDTHTLTKRATGHVAGGVVNESKSDEDKLGVDFMTATARALRNRLMEEAGSRKTLGALLLDQGVIAGIGVAWGSEICARAGVTPSTKVLHVNVEELARAVVHVRDAVKALYDGVVDRQCTNATACAEFVNGWFKNLYSAREGTLTVYGVGDKITVAGRNWWVKR